ncbi:MAG: NAD(P)H-hydrate dehydratase [Candidatus Dormibacteria bacterium]
MPLPVGAGGFGAAAASAVAAQMLSADAVVCGPGLGAGADPHAFLLGVLRALAGRGGRLVLDADGLNAVAASAELRAVVPPGCVLTPHPLEAARLAGAPVAEIQRDRVGCARELATELGATVVLKGAETVVADPRGEVWVDGHSTPVLATGGTGDVLAGLIGALIAQGLAPAEAARAGVFLHGTAGTWLAETRGRAGILASEVADALVGVQEAVRRLRGEPAPG